MLEVLLAGWGRHRADAAVRDMMNSDGMPEVYRAQGAFSEMTKIQALVQRLKDALLNSEEE